MTLDFGGTIVEGGVNKGLFIPRLRKLLAEYGVEASGGEVRRAVSEALTHLNEVRERFMEMRFEDFYSIVLRRLGAPATEDVLERVFDVYSRSFEWRLIPGAVETVLKLHSMYRLAVVSNTMSRMPVVILEETGLSGLFDAVILSRDVGWRKPHPNIFNKALEALGVPGNQAAHVGDSPESDVAGAKSVGMVAVLVGKPTEPVDPPPDIHVESISEVPRALEGLQDP